MAGRWPFVGRSMELALAKTLITGGTGVLLLGPAGIGKTALARHLVDGRNGVGHVLGSPEAIGTSFEAFSDLLGAASGSGQLDAAGVEQQVRRSLEPGHLLLVDDIDLLDVDSAQVLLRLASATSGLRSVIVATARSGRLSGPADALWRGGFCRRIELSGLSEDEVGLLLETALDGPVPVPVADTFATRSQGNPLLLRELTQAALDRSVLVCRDGAWVLTGTPPLTGGVRDVVSERLAGLDDTQRAGLEAVAAGEPLPAEVALEMIGEDTLISLEESRLVRVTQGIAGQSVTTEHPLYGEVLRDEMPLLRLRRLRLTLAGVLEAGAHPAAHDLVRAATWRLDCGQPGDPQRLLAAARAARAISLPTAERLARQAYEMQHSLPASLLLAEILTQTGRHADATALLGELPPDSLSPEDRESLVYVAAFGQALLTGDTEGGAEIVAGLSSGDAAASQYVRAAHAFLLAFDARPDEALEIGLPILTDDCAPPPIRTLAALGAVGAEYWLGRADDAVTHADLIFPVTTEATAREAMPFGTSSVELLAVCALVESGALDQAEVRAERLRGLSREAADPFGIPRAEYCLARCALARGLSATAVRHLRRCVAAVGPFDQFIVRHLQSVLARAAATAGDVVLASASLAAGTGSAVMKTYEPEWDLAEAAVLAAQLRMDEAADRAAWAAGVAADSHLWCTAVAAYHDAARYGAAREVLPAMQEAADQFDGRLSRIYVDHVAALVAADPAALDLVARRFRDLGAELHASEASAEAALLHAAAGNQRASRVSGEWSAERRRSCEDSVSPWLVGAQRAVPLTARERQVAALAIAGLADADIADRLQISKRTAQTHLAHIYDKLGIHGRGQLATHLTGTPS